jgi:fibronectin-binding autotransporter adhesin
MLGGFVLMASAAVPLHAQTTLGVGDISFISAEGDTNGAVGDGYSIVTWQSLAAGTVLKFTDNGMSNAGATAANTTEHVWTFTVGASAIAAGTTLNFGFASPTAGKWNGPASGTTSTNVSPFTNAGISTSGDQFFVYQGTGTGANLTSTPAGAGTFTGTLIGGINFGPTITSGTPDSNNTYAPTSLVNGNAYLNGGNFDNAYYNGVRTGLSNTLYRAATNNAGNFTFTETLNASYDRTTGFTIASAASIHWDSNGSTTGDGGTGTWDTTTNDRFKNSAAGTTRFRWVNSSTGNDHTAVFGGTAGTVSVSGGVTASGMQFDVSGYTIQSSTVTLAGSAPTIQVTAAAHTATVSSVLAGSNGLTKSGAGTLITTGANNYSGGTTVSAGTLQIGNGGTTGTLGSGAVTNNGALVFNRSDNFNVSTTIAGSGTLTKEGDGIMTLLGISDYSGNTIVNDGTLAVDGTASSSSFTVNNGATLRGNGSTGAVTVASGGRVGPGNSAGSLNTGNFNLQAGGFLDIELDGSTPGTGYDRLNVTGSATLAGLLAVTAGFTPEANALFFILVNDGSDAITGTFTGLANNSIFNVSGKDYQISYFADSASNSFAGGNDVALMAIPEPTAAVLMGMAGLALLGYRRR